MKKFKKAEDFDIEIAAEILDCDVKIDGDYVYLSNFKDDKSWTIEAARCEGFIK